MKFGLEPCLFLLCPGVVFCTECIFFVPTAVCLFCPVSVFFVLVRFFLFGVPPRSSKDTYLNVFCVLFTFSRTLPCSLSP